MGRSPRERPPRCRGGAGRAPARRPPVGPRPRRGPRCHRHRPALGSGRAGGGEGRCRIRLQKPSPGAAWKSPRAGSARAWRSSTRSPTGSACSNTSRRERPRPRSASSSAGSGCAWSASGGQEGGLAMPRKTNSLADALQGSAQPEPSPKRPQEKRGQRDGSTRLVGAHFPEPRAPPAPHAGRAGGPQHALRAGRGAERAVCQVEAAADRLGHPRRPGRAAQGERFRSNIRSVRRTAFRR